MELASVWDAYERLGLALCPWITSSIWGISAPVCLYNKITHKTKRIEMRIMSIMSWGLQVEVYDVRWGLLAFYKDYEDYQYFLPK